MKKTWSDPEVVSLSVQETFGGPIPEFVVDGDIWWSEGRQDWNVPFGVS